MISAAKIITLWGPFYKAEKCDKVASFYNSTETFHKAYPSCNLSTDYVAVKADMNAGNAGNAAAALDLSFGMAVWLALALHAIGVEIYVSDSPLATFSFGVLRLISISLLAPLNSRRVRTSAQDFLPKAARGRVQESRASWLDFRSTGRLCAVGSGAGAPRG